MFPKADSWSSRKRSQKASKKHVSVEHAAGEHSGSVTLGSLWGVEDSAAVTGSHVLIYGLPPRQLGLDAGVLLSSSGEAVARESPGIGQQSGELSMLGSRVRCKWHWQPAECISVDSNPQTGRQAEVASG